MAGFGGAAEPEGGGGGGEQGLWPADSAVVRIDAAFAPTGV